MLPRILKWGSVLAFAVTIVILANIAYKEITAERIDIAPSSDEVISIKKSEYIERVIPFIVNYGDVIFETDSVLYTSEKDLVYVSTGGGFTITTHTGFEDTNRDQFYAAQDLKKQIINKPGVVRVTRTQSGTTINVYNLIGYPAHAVYAGLYGDEDIPLYANEYFTFETDRMIPYGNYTLVIATFDDGSDPSELEADQVIRVRLSLQPIEETSALPELADENFEGWLFGINNITPFIEGQVAFISQLGEDINTGLTAGEPVQIKEINGDIITGIMQNGETAYINYIFLRPLSGSLFDIEGWTYNNENQTRFEIGDAVRIADKCPPLNNRFPCGNSFTVVGIDNNILFVRNHEGEVTQYNEVWFK